MIWPQTLVGQVEPVMYCSPPKGVSDCSEPSSPGWNMATAVTSCGVKPTNQAERIFSEVPVLPATGRPPMIPSSLRAEPTVGGPCRATVAFVATSWSIARFSSFSCS